MIACFNIKSVMVIKGACSDRVLIETDLPACTYPFNEPPSLHFDVAYDQGVDYVRKNFNVEPEVIERSHDS